DIGHGIGHLVDVAIIGLHFHIHTGTLFRLLRAPGRRQYGDLAAVEFEQSIAIELDHAALEGIDEALHLLIRGTAAVAYGHHAASDALEIDHRIEDLVEPFEKGVGILLVQLAVGVQYFHDPHGGIFHYLMGCS